MAILGLFWLLAIAPFLDIADPQVRWLTHPSMVSWTEKELLLKVVLVTRAHFWGRDWFRSN